MLSSAFPKCEPSKKVTHHQAYPAVFEEKQEVSEQLAQWKIQSKSYSIC